MKNVARRSFALEGYKEVTSRFGTRLRCMQDLWLTTDVKGHDFSSMLYLTVLSCYFSVFLLFSICYKLRSFKRFVIQTAAKFGILFFSYFPFKAADS